MAELTMGPKVEHSKTVKKDKDGYYLVNLGALNVENTSGIFYEAGDDVMSAFTGPNSLIKERLEAKCLYAENNHPVHSPELLARAASQDPKIRKKAMMEINLRTIKLDPDRYAAHIKSVTYTTIPTVVDKMTGKPKILMTGLVKPFGPFKEQLEDAFENPNISVAFSLRGIAIERNVGGRKTRKVTLGSTWDYVGKPGIPGSTDQAVLGYESAEEYNIALEETITFNRDAQTDVIGEADIKCVEFTKIKTTRTILDNW